MPGLFSIHPELTWALHHAPTEPVEYKCPKCDVRFSGPVREVYEQYTEHVLDRMYDLDEAHELEDCGSCGAYHFPDFNGDCREDWERF